MDTKYVVPLGVGGGVGCKETRYMVWWVGCKDVRYLVGCRGFWMYPQQ